MECCIEERRKKEFENHIKKVFQITGLKEEDLAKEIVTLFVHDKEIESKAQQKDIFFKLLSPYLEGVKKPESPYQLIETLKKQDPEGYLISINSTLGSTLSEDAKKELEEMTSTSQITSKIAI